MIRYFFMTLMASTLLASCAFTPHNVAVNPETTAAPSTIGEGTTLALKVVDDRDDIVVGQRGVGMQGADITANGIIPAIESELKSGLEAKGFTVLPARSDADAEFEARLRAFKFFIESGFWTGAENTSVVINVEAEKGSKDYERGYRSNTEERTMVIPAGASIDEKLNGALSVVLNKIMADSELMEFLAD